MVKTSNGVVEQTMTPTNQLGVNSTLPQEKIVKVDSWEESFRAENQLAGSNSMCLKLVNFPDWWNWSFGLD